MESIEPCHSEASNISITSEESPTKYDDKMKKKEMSEDEYGKRHETTSRVLLDLKLANDALISKANPSSKLELNLLKSPGGGEGSSQASESKTFTCNFCRREFSTSQALGGHQNAHKQERALAKHRHNMVDMTVAAAGSPPPYGYSYYPYSSFPHQIPLYGNFNRSLGVRSESMIQKPYSHHHPWSPPPPSYGCRFGREKMTRTYFISPSTSTTPYDGLRVENFQSRALGVEKFGGSLGLGGNPNFKTMDSACSKTTTKGNEGDDENQRLRLGSVDDQFDASGLDLNLKL